MGFISRSAKRFLPNHSVTVALLDNEIPVAYGVVKNISEAGACIITDSPLAQERSLRFKMSFYRSGIVAAGGRVVWSQAVKEPGVTSSSTVHGVEFNPLSGAERDRLKGILESPDFGMAVG